MTLPQRTFKVSTQPVSEPLSLADLKSALRVTVHDFDIELKRLLRAARQQLEKDTQRRFMSQTVVMYLDDWFDYDGRYGRYDDTISSHDHSVYDSIQDYRVVEIREAPVTSIDSVEYYDSDGNLQTLATTDYFADTVSTPARVVLKDGYHWPNVESGRPNPIQITFTAGYSNAATVPAEANVAIIEWVRSKRGCDDAAAKYESLVSSLQWTAHHR